MPKQTSALRRALPWLFLAGVAVLTLYMDVYVARNILDGDASDFLRRGYTIAQSGNPFPTDYYYTTELRLVDSPLIFSIFFHFTENWTAARILGTALMQGLYVLSFLFLCRSSRLTWGVSAGSAAFLPLPFSTPYARIALYHLYYINYLSEAFLMLGLTLRLMECRDRRKGMLPGVALAALWMFVGSNGVRHMMILGAPMLALASVWTVSTLRRYTWHQGRLEGDFPFPRTEVARLWGVLLASCACFLIGYALYSGVLVKLFGLRDFSAMYFSPTKDASSYADIFNGWLSAIGARDSGLPLVGIRGVALAASLFSFGYLLWASGASAAQSGELAPRLMSGMLLSSLVVTGLIFVFDTSWRPHELYLVPVVAFAFPTLARELALLKARAVNAGRKLLILLTCACFLFQGGYTYCYLLGNHSLDEWKGLTMGNMVPTAREYTDVIMASGYTHVLAPWWYANTIMELSDGRVKATTATYKVEDGRLVAYLEPWGTSKSDFAAENLPPTLLLLTNDAEPGEEVGPPDVRRIHTFTYASGSEVYLYSIPSDCFHNFPENQ